MLTQPDRYDVALLHLDRPVFYQENIIPICLPPLDIPLQVHTALYLSLLYLCIYLFIHSFI